MHIKIARRIALYLGPKIRKRDVNQFKKIVAITPTLVCDYKPRRIRALCGGKTNVVCDCCYIIVLCSVSVRIFGPGLYGICVSTLYDCIA